MQSIESWECTLPLFDPRICLTALLELSFLGDRTSLYYRSHSSRKCWWRSSFHRSSSLLCSAHVSGDAGFQQSGFVFSHCCPDVKCLNRREHPNSKWVIAGRIHRKYIEGVHRRTFQRQGIVNIAIFLIFRTCTCGQLLQRLHTFQHPHLFSKRCVVVPQCVDFFRVSLSGSFLLADRDLALSPVRCKW